MSPVPWIALKRRMSSAGVRMMKLVCLGELDLEGDRLPVPCPRDKKVDASVLGWNPDVPPRIHTLDVFPDQILTHVHCKQWLHLFLCQLLFDRSV